MLQGHKCTLNLTKKAAHRLLQRRINEAASKCETFVSLFLSAATEEADLFQRGTCMNFCMHAHEHARHLRGINQTPGLAGHSSAPLSQLEVKRKREGGGCFTSLGALMTEESGFTKTLLINTGKRSFVDAALTTV